MSPVPTAFLLQRPWGLYAAEAAVRTPFDGSGPLEVVADSGLLLAAPDGAEVVISGRRMAAQPEGLPFEWWGWGRWRLYSLPIALETGKPVPIKVIVGGTAVARELVLRDALARPQKGRANQADASGDDPADDLDRLVKEVLERLRGLADLPQAEPLGVTRRVPGVRIDWGQLADRWLAEIDKLVEPPMDIIVRHAEDLARLVGDLAEHPRRVLTRTRERQAIGRIQEMDTACLIWYVRQPGLTAAQKAGGRQQLLAVVRREDFDTLENRVLKDYLLRAEEAALGYVRLHGHYRRSTRLDRVRRYGRLARRLARDLDCDGIGAPTLPPKPNYVLLHDGRYRNVWRAYLDLLRRKSEEDEAWRWQSRLWADFVRLSVQVGLEHLPGCTRVARAPLVVRTEQERGRWTDLPPQTGVYLLRLAGRTLVVTILDVQADEAHRHIGDRHFAVGASAVLRVDDLEDGGVAEVVIWAVHGTGAQLLDTRALTVSADAALQKMRAVAEVRGDKWPTTRGLVIASRPSHGDDAADPVEEGHGDVLGLRIAASSRHLEWAVRKCGETVALAIGDMLA